MPNLAEARERLINYYLQSARTLDTQQDFQTLDTDWLQISAILTSIINRKAGEWAVLPAFVDVLNRYWDARGLTQEWILWCQHAAEISIISRDYLGVTNYIGRLGNVYLLLGDTELAITCYKHALALAQEIGSQHWEAIWMSNLGATYRYIGKAYQAIEYSKKSITIWQLLGELRGMSSDLGNLGGSHYILGEVERTIYYFQQAVAIARQINDRVEESTWLTNLGIAYRANGQQEEAFICYQQALKIQRSIGDRNVSRTVRQKRTEKYPRKAKYL